MLFQPLFSLQKETHLYKGVKASRQLKIKAITSAALFITPHLNISFGGRAL